jgi:hypothetical protein
MQQAMQPRGSSRERNSLPMAKKSSAPVMKTKIKGGK